MESDHNLAPLSRKEITLSLSSLPKHIPSLGLKFLLLCVNQKYGQVLLVVAGAFYIFMFGYVTYGKTIRRDETGGMINLADHVHNFVLTLSNISTVLIVRNCQTRENINKILSFILSQKYRKNPFEKLGIALAITCLAACVASVLTFGMYLGWSSCRFYSCRDIQFCILNLSLYTLSQITYYFKEMFSSINEEFLPMIAEYLKSCQQLTNMTTCCKLTEPKDVITYINKTNKCISQVTSISKRHNELCNVLDDFNSIFGTLIFLATLNITSNTVWAITLIAHFNVPALLKTLKGFDVPIIMVIPSLVMNIIWIFLMAAQSVLIGTAGRALTIEG